MQKTAAKPGQLPLSARLRYIGEPLLALAVVAAALILLLDPLLTLIDGLLEPLLDPLAQIGISEPVLQTMLVSAILALSIYITLYGGMFSLANAGFMGIGAYTGAIITKNFETSFAVSILLGMLFSGVIALLISVPVLRLRNIYLAIATIGFGEIVVVTVNRFDATLLDLYRNNERATPIIQDIYDFLNVEVNFTRSGIPTRAIITGGASGLKNIPQTTETAHLVLFVILVAYIMFRIQRSRFGRALNAIRQDEKVAASQGINVVYYKNLAFLIGAVIAGAAGAFDAHRDTLIEPGDYGFNQAVEILGYAVLGGTNSWAGSIIGGMTLQGLPELLRELQEYSGVMTGLTLLLTIVYLPGGLISLFRLDFWQQNGRFAMARRISVAGLAVIFIANVLPFQRSADEQERVLGNVFLQDQAEAAPLAFMGLALAGLAAYSAVMWQQGYFGTRENLRIPPNTWRPILTAIGVLAVAYVFNDNIWHLGLGNSLVFVALYWVLNTPEKDEGGRFSVPLAMIAIVAFLLWGGLALNGTLEDLMLAYYMQLLGLGILAGGALVPYASRYGDETRGEVADAQVAAG
jgi:branched-chain amino acid transport system permease protein